MRMLNQATEDADAFLKMLEKATKTSLRQEAPIGQFATAEVQEWNAAVERKKAEKRAAKGKRR